MYIVPHTIIGKMTWTRLGVITEMNQLEADLLEEDPVLQFRIYKEEK